MQNKRMERKNIMEELTRKDILDSAVTILIEKGIEKLTKESVASGAGIAKGTVYLYYTNKKVLLDAVLDYGYLPLQEEFHRIIREKAEPLWKLEQCILGSLRHTEENKSLLKQLRTVLFATMDQRISDKNSWYWTIVDMLGEVLEQASASGMIRPVNYVKVSALFIDSINSLIAHRIFSERKETIEQDVEALLDQYINGLKRKKS